MLVKTLTVIPQKKNGIRNRKYCKHWSILIFADCSTQTLNVHQSGGRNSRIWNSSISSEISFKSLYLKVYETAYLKHCVFYLIFSENDIALIEDGSEHSLNPIILTDDDIRKIEDEENFEKVYDESRKLEI